MDFEYIDIHSHLYFPDYEPDRERQIEEMKKAKIATISIGTSLETSKMCIDLAEKNKNIFACVGQHPSDLNTASIFERDIIQLTKNKKVVSIGECGLDYFRLPVDNKILKEIQKSIFIDHINLSVETAKPLMLHIRPSPKSFDAYLEALEILENKSKEVGGKLKGNAHFFAGDMGILKRFLGIGFTASFTGVITFVKDYDDFITYMPLDMIMSETDSPFGAPNPYRGQRNSPLYISEVVKRIAEIKSEPLEKVKKALVNNAISSFNLI